MAAEADGVKVFKVARWRLKGQVIPEVLEQYKSVGATLNVLPFCTRRFTNRPAVDLAAKLVNLAPGSLSKILFAPGGTSAIGIALKLARLATGRFKTISMWDAFHGASLVRGPEDQLGAGRRSQTD